MNKKQIEIVFFLPLLLCQCDKEKYRAEIPAYLYIDKVILTTSYSSQGTSSHKITDVWVYVDDDLKGVFEMPAKIPLLYKGKHKVSVRAGIKVNGIANTRAAYPFYTTYVTEIDFRENKTDTLIPQFTYESGVNFPYKEDFDQAGFNFFYTNGSQSQFILTTGGEQFEGNYSASASLTSTQTFFEAYTTEIYNLPKNQRPVFLELNYRCNTTLVVGLFYDSPVPTMQRALIYLNPTEEWNKIYINMTEALAEQQSATRHMISFGFTNQDATEKKIWIDNIKVVTF